jgi:serine/threonine protein kinase
VSLAPGVILDNRYELMELLGEGGMGQVFKARHNRLGKLFAVKSLRHLSPDPTEQAKFLDAFESEARTLAELDHPALAKVSDFFEMHGVHFLVMEFIDGKTLARVVELAPRNLSQRRVKQWAEELCDVLGYLHAQRPPVIVRDLKPENIMIDSRRRLRLIDFGISKRLRPGEGTRDIVKGMGTAEYAPLEQYGNSTTDQRSDIYAMGATLYFLLTEIAPPPAWKRASEGVEPVLPSQVNPSITPEFEALIMSMMALKKENRPQTIDAVLKALEGIEDTPSAKLPRAATPLSVPRAQAASPISVPPPVRRAPPPAAVPNPPDYSSTPNLAAQRYGLPGSSLDRPKMAVKPSTTGRVPQIRVLSCKSLRRYASTPQAVRTCPGQPLLAVAGRYLQVWSMETEQMAKKLWTGEQQLVSVDFSADGRHLFAAELEGKIRQYDMRTDEKLTTLGRRSWGLFPDRVRDICTLYGRSKLAVASDTSNIRIFDTASGVITEVLDWHQTGLLSKLGKKTMSLASSKDGFLASGGADGTVTVFEKGGFEQKFHKAIGRGEIVALEFSPNGELLGVADSRGIVYLLKSPTFEVVRELKHPSSPRAISFSHDMRLIATGASDCQIRFFYLNNGNELERLSHHKGGILGLDFDDLEPKLVSVGNDRRLYVTHLAW